MSRLDLRVIVRLKTPSISRPVNIGNLNFLNIYNLDIGLTFLCCKPAVSRCSLTRKSSKSMELWGPWQQRLWSIRMESPVLGEVVTLPVEIRKVENYCGTLVQLALVCEIRFMWEFNLRCACYIVLVLVKNPTSQSYKYLLWSGRLKHTLHQSPASPYI